MENNNNLIPEEIEEKIIEEDIEENIEEPEIILKNKGVKKKKNIALFLIGIVAVLGLVVAGYSTYNYINLQKVVSNAEWICIQKKCVEYQTEDEWIYQNCYERDKDDSTCDLFLNGQEFQDVPKPENISPDILKCEVSKCLLSSLVKMENKEYWEEELLNQFEQMKNE